jgi:TolB protein
MVMRGFAIVSVILCCVVGAPDAGAPGVEPTGEIGFATNRDGNYEIYTMKADGSKPVNLTRHEGLDYGPSWSPDGRRLAFQTDRDGNDEIYVMNADGSGLLNLTKHPARDTAPRWSPDGKRIAFCRQLSAADSTGHGGRAELFVMDADGSNERRLTERPGFNSGPAWSPDGRRIAFHSTSSGGADIVIMDADGRNPTVLTSSEAEDYYPAWSPDGRWIVYCSGQAKQYNLWRVHPDGTERQRLTDHPGRDQAPAWRPTRRP